MKVIIIKPKEKMVEWTQLDYQKTAIEMVKSSNNFHSKLGEAIQVGQPHEKQQVSTKFAKVFRKYYELTIK